MRWIVSQTFWLSLITVSGRTMRLTALIANERYAAASDVQRLGNLKISK